MSLALIAPALAEEIPDQSQDRILRQCMSDQAKSIIAESIPKCEQIFVNTGIDCASIANNIVAELSEDIFEACKTEATNSTKEKTP